MLKLFRHCSLKAFLHPPRTPQSGVNKSFAFNLFLHVTFFALTPSFNIDNFRLQLVRSIIFQRFVFVVQRFERIQKIAIHHKISHNLRWISVCKLIKANHSLYGIHLFIILKCEMREWVWSVNSRVSFRRVEGVKNYPWRKNNGSLLKFS